MYLQEPVLQPAANWMLQLRLNQASAPLNRTKLAHALKGKGDAILWYSSVIVVFHGQEKHPYFRKMTNTVSDQQ
jgi:hypothetical protein